MKLRARGGLATLAAAVAVTLVGGVGCSALRPSRPAATTAAPAPSGDALGSASPDSPEASQEATPTPTENPPSAHYLPEPEAQAAQRYWTPERMRRATPADHRISSTSTAPSTTTAAPDDGGAPITIPGQAPTRGSALAPSTLPPASPARLTGAVAPVRQASSVDAVPATPTIGKVFYQAGGKDWMCSASTVPSAHHNLVLTAAHCLYEQGTWATQWVYVPAYHDGEAPFGVWPAIRAWVTPAWQASQQSDAEASADASQHDIGFVAIRTRDGRNIGAVVGYNGIAFGRGVTVDVTAIGYPAEPPYDGETLRGCRATTQQVASLSLLAVPCELTGGASGGPWLYGYQAAQGWGYTDGVNSLLARTPQGAVVASPYFGKEAYLFWRSVAATPSVAGS